jgi:hypothetical protein
MVEWAIKTVHFAGQAPSGELLQLVEFLDGSFGVLVGERLAAGPFAGHHAIADGVEAYRALRAETQLSLPREPAEMAPSVTTLARAIA